MRLAKLAGFFLAAIAVLAIRVSAATFTDDLTLTQNNAEAQYFNLKPYAGAAYGLSSQSTLTFSDTSSPFGYALYRVNGAEKITVGIYTFYGTCVSQGEDGLILGLGSKQAIRSKSENAVYSDYGGSWRIELNNRYIPTFYPADSLPRDTVGYGVNIYASPNLEKPLTAVVTKSAIESLCYEEYTVELPASAQYVKVEVNDITSYPIRGGGTVQNRVYTLLASVRISGESLMMGEPAKVVQQPSVSVQGPADEDEAEESAVGAFAATDLPKDTEFEGETQVVEEKSSSSKFEGTITSSSKSEKKESSKAETQIEETSQASSSAKSAPADEPPQRETVYEVRREKDDGLLSSGVTAYIIIVTGALVLLLILGRKR